MSFRNCKNHHAVSQGNRGMKSLLKAVSYVVLAGIVGCSVPIRHHVFSAPQISGTVTRAGKPVSGIHVQLVDVLNASGEPSATATSQEAVTDAQGHFTLGPIKQVEHKLDNPLLKVDQRTVPWGLRFSSDDHTWQGGWLSDPDMFGEVPATQVAAECDLATDSKSSVIDGDIAIVGKGPCHLKLAVTGKK
jgi:hypothetical protein